VGSTLVVAAAVPFTSSRLQPTPNPTNQLTDLAVPLFLSVLLIAACGLIYELVASALASYLLGDSVTQFSTVIGTYLFAMGVGSWLSRFISRERSGGDGRPMKRSAFRGEMEISGAPGNACGVVPKSTGRGILSTS